MLFLHAEYTRSFFSISTLYTRRHWLKKKGKVSTNTVHYDKSGNGHIFCDVIFNFVQPTPEIWMLSGLQKQNLPPHTVEHRFLVNFCHFKSFLWILSSGQIDSVIKVLCPLKKLQKKYPTSPVKLTLFWETTSNIDPGKYMRDVWHAWTCRGTNEVIW